MKQYKDKRINTILNNFELALKNEDKNYSKDIKELYNDIDKVLDYVSRKSKGKLYLNSKISENCYNVLDKILSLYNLKFVLNDKRYSEYHQVVSVTEYIKIECKKFDLDSNTPTENIKKYYYTLTGLSDDETDVKTVQAKKEYLYEYLLDNMVKSDEISSVQALNFYNHYVKTKFKDKIK